MKTESWADSPIHEKIRAAGLDNCERIAQGRLARTACSRLDETPDADDVKNGLLHTADDHPCCRQLIYAAHRLIDQIEGERDHYATMLCEAMRVVYATTCHGDSTDLIDRFEALELTPAISSENAESIHPESKP